MPSLTTDAAFQAGWGASYLPMELLVGGGRFDRSLNDPDVLLDAYRTDDGLRYLDYRSIADPNVRCRTTWL